MSQLVHAESLAEFPGPYFDFIRKAEWACIVDFCLLLEIGLDVLKQLLI